MAPYVLKARLVEDLYGFIDESELSITDQGITWFRPYSARVEDDFDEVHELIERTLVPADNAEIRDAWFEDSESGSGTCTITIGPLLW